MENFFTIIKKYPFIDFSEDPIEVLFQFDFPPAWHKLFIELCDSLLAYTINHPKAKLKIFFEIKASNKENKAIRHMINVACRRSGHICSYCGAPAEVVTKGYVLPLCYKCARQLNKDENKRHKTHFSFKKVYRKI